MDHSLYRLDDLCRIYRTGVTGFTRAQYLEGPFPVLGNSPEPRGMHAEHNVPAGAIVVTRTGVYGQVSRHDVPTFVTDEAFVVEPLQPATGAYLFAYLKHVVAAKLRKARSAPFKVLPHDKLAGLYVLLPDARRQAQVVSLIDKAGGVDPSLDGLVGYACFSNRRLEQEASQRDVDERRGGWMRGCASALAVAGVAAFALTACPNIGVAAAMSVTA